MEFITDAVRPVARKYLIIVEERQFRIRILFISLFTVIDEHFSQRTHLQIDVFAGRDHFGKVDIKNKVRALYLGHGHRRNRNLGVIIDIVAAINALSLARFCKLINIPDGRAVPRIALKAR